MTTTAEKLRKLADFLVPENGPDRMCRNWRHIFENKSRSAVSSKAEASYYCFLGAIDQLFGSSSGLDTAIQRYNIPWTEPRPDPSALRKQLLAAADQCEREAE